MKNKLKIPSVNYHLWEPCNMRCKFCFATFKDVKNSILPKGHIPEKQAIKVIQQLAKYGFEKITFAGGEPLLCPWISKLIQEAKKAGMTTMLVTNGSKINENFLLHNKENLDWIALSIDSLNNTTNLKTGRAVIGKKILNKTYYKNTIDQIKNYGYALKINTVVTKLNYKENLSELIQYANPKRWKVLQVLPIKGQNDLTINNFTITEEEFNYFLNTHKNITQRIAESNNAIKGSYVMIDPAGRFFDNSEGKHKYSEPILKVGVKNAIKNMNYDTNKFIKRGGKYNFKNPKK